MTDKDSDGVTNQSSNEPTDQTSNIPVITLQCQNLANELIELLRCVGGWSECCFILERKAGKRSFTAFLLE